MVVMLKWRYQVPSDALQNNHCVLGIDAEPELNAAWDVFSSFPEELNLFA